jgi:adenylate cyclase
LSVLKKTLLRWAVVTLAATAAAIGLARTDWHRALENVYYDYWHVLSGKRYEPKHTVFVSVDDATLLAYKDDPLAFWTPYWARALDVLGKAGVKAAGLDFIYLVSAESWLRKLKLPDSQISREYDSAFRAVLAQGKTILITHLVDLPDGSLDLLLPPDDQRLLLPGGPKDLGIANLHPDADKHVRSFFPVMVPDPNFPGLAFNMQLALRGAGADAGAAEWQIAGTTLKRELKRYPIGYTGPSGTIQKISMLELLRPDAGQQPAVQALAGRVAIIGLDNAGNSDRHFTPYSRGRDAEQMAGAEIHANIVETILSGRYPKSPSLAPEALYVLLIAGLATWAFLRASVGAGAAIGLGLVIAVALPAFLAFRHDWMLPVAEQQGAITLAFLMTLGLRLTGEERERARTRKMFERYLAAPVVAKLLAEDRRPDLSGETLTLTVLFSDIRGFTTFSEKLNAHEVVEMLNAYFTRVVEPILAQGGTLDKYIGDAVMAEFGSPVAYPDHARRAIRAALGMAREAEAFKEWMRKRFPDRGLAEFGIGIGLHSGQAVCGNIGAPMKQDYTAIGDTVNAASRLEGITKDMKVVIAASQATLDAAGPGVRTGKRETVTVKGRAEPIVVYEITGIDDA